MKIGLYWILDILKKKNILVLEIFIFGPLLGFKINILLKFRFKGKETIKSVCSLEKENFVNNFSDSSFFS